MNSVDFSKTYSEGTFPNKWIHGTHPEASVRDPLIQVHKYNTNTIIMRQSKDITFEAPFIFLLFGKEKALLIDTGATKEAKKFPLRKTVDKLINNWLQSIPSDNYQLIITHTHGHNDHTTGDVQFVDRKNTILVKKDIESLKSFFKIKNWPQDIISFDLGGRIIDIIPTPGHDDREISFYDRWTKILLTGDLIYPGRLYIKDFSAFNKSISTLIKFSKKNEIKYLLGCHIEITNKNGVDYPTTTKYQPQEPPLQMKVGQLKLIQNAISQTKGKPGVHKFDTFIIWIGPCTNAVLKHLVKGFLYNIRYRIRLIVN